MNNVFKSCFAILFASTPAAIDCSVWRRGRRQGTRCKRHLQKADRCGEQARSAGCQRVGVELTLHPFCRQGASGLARVLGHRRCNAAPPRYVSAAFPDRSNLRRRKGRLYHTGNCGNLRAGADHRGVWRPESGSQTIRNGVDLDQDFSGMEDDDRHPDSCAARTSRALKAEPGVKMQGKITVTDAGGLVATFSRMSSLHGNVEMT